MTTWQTVLDRTRRFVGDVKVDGRTPRVLDSELVDFWEAAQDDLVQYVARLSSFTVPEDTTAGLLPDDVARIDAVIIDDGTNNFFVLHEGWDDVGDYDHLDGTYWYLTHDQIQFTQELDYAATVRYRAYYPAPDVNQLSLPCLLPRWAIHAGLYYVASETLEKQSIADPQLRQWASKTQDAGNPTHNPFLEIAKYMLERYRQIAYDYTQDAENQRLTWPSLYR